jgi:hypothetical protein
MNDRRDDELRAAFRELKGETVTGVPSFASLTSGAAMDAARRRHRRQRVVFMAALLLPAAFILRPRSPAEPDFQRFIALTGIDLSEVTWRAPSDVLLDVPGRDLLRGFPLIEIHMQPVPQDSVRLADSNATKRRSSS